MFPITKTAKTKGTWYLADRITPATVYEMLEEAKGLMCVLTKERADQLGFTKMVAHSTDPNETPFMTTVDGAFEATGVTTGVSAFDRAATINHIANDAAKQPTLTTRVTSNRCTPKTAAYVSG